MRELTIAELKAVSGGVSNNDVLTANILNTRHDTAKNSVGNIR